MPKKNDEFVIEFSKPHTFEGKEYKNVDLSGLEELNGSDLIDADQELIASGKQAMVNELSLPYLVIIAAKACKQPEHFFLGLPAKDLIRVKNTVMGFLNK